MADISKIKIGSTTYDIKDTTARNSITWKTPSKLFSRTDSNTWKKGVQKTLSTAPQYLIFGTLLQADTTSTVQLGMCLGTWSDPTNRTGSNGVTCATSLDTGSTSYTLRASFIIASSGTKWTLEAASWHVLDTNGHSGVNAQINELWGLL